MRDTILFIVEGRSAEPKILDSLWKHFFEEKHADKFHVSFDSNIYELWKMMQEDGNLELLEVLVERSAENAQTVKQIKHRISQIFLFFDYDGHAEIASDDELTEMLQFFNDDTDETRGKLFISYPMAESLRHFNPELFDFVKLTNLISEGAKYKKLVGERAKHQDLRKFNDEVWDELTVANLCKGSFLISGDHVLPANVESVDQPVLFQNQMEKHIYPHEEIAVLSGFPFFLFHYFGESILNRLRKLV